jgi:hypothetical protein
MAEAKEILIVPVHLGETAGKLSFKVLLPTGIERRWLK